MVNRGANQEGGGGSAGGDEGGKDDELSVSETISMLKFGAACIFQGAGDEPPTDAEIDAIIDRTRTDSDSLGGIVGGKQSNAADFDAAAPMLNLRELQGASYGDKVPAAEKKRAKDEAKDGEAKEEGEASGAQPEAAPKSQEPDLQSVAAMLGGGTLADIGEQWEALRNNKRASKSRLTSTYVDGVGQVTVLRENDYGMGDEMPNAQSGKRQPSGGGEGRAGRWP